MRRDDRDERGIPRLTNPRLEPVARVAERAREYAQGRLVAPVNLTATMAHAKPVSRAIQAFADTMMDPELIAERLREIVILRTGWNTNAIYEWGQHVMASRRIGMTDEEILAVQGDPEDWPWTPLEAASIRMADELCADDCISDSTWNSLTAATDVQTAVALLALCGSYRMVAGVLNGLGIQPEPGLPGWDLEPTLPGERP